jgi:hypothetical protein
MVMIEETVGTSPHLNRPGTGSPLVTAPKIVTDPRECTIANALIKVIISTDKSLLEVKKRSDQKRNTTGVIPGRIVFSSTLWGPRVLLYWAKLYLMRSPTSTVEITLIIPPCSKFLP